jgi:hypothetical protein
MREWKFVRSTLLSAVDEATDLGLLPELNAIVVEYCLSPTPEAPKLGSEDTHQVCSTCFGKMCEPHGYPLFSGPSLFESMTSQSDEEAHKRAKIRETNEWIAMYS